jgi:hypothetical protein
LFTSYFWVDMGANNRIKIENTSYHIGPTCGSD